MFLQNINLRQTRHFFSSELLRFRELRRFSQLFARDFLEISAFITCLFVILLRVKMVALMTQASEAKQVTRHRREATARRYGGWMLRKLEDVERSDAVGMQR